MTGNAETWWEGLMHQDGIGIPFICDSCKNKNHEECPGKGQCDCQHRTGEK